MSVSQRLRFNVFMRDGFRCQYCGRAAPDVELEADHVHPRSKGGPDTMANLVTACVACNGGKRATVMPIHAWRLGAGPLDGATVWSAAAYPLVWVYQAHDGTMLRFADEWLSEDSGDGYDIPSNRFRYGHPAMRSPRDPGYGMKHFGRGAPAPVLLGAYSTAWAVVADEATGVVHPVRGELRWATPDAVLCWFTDLVSQLHCAGWAPDCTEAGD